jgi:hypothetical protein
MDAKLIYFRLKYITEKFRLKNGVNFERWPQRDMGGHMERWDGQIYIEWLGKGV